MIFTALPSTTQLVMMFWKAITLVKSDFPLVNKYWLVLIIFFSTTCLEMTSRISCYITFLRMEVRHLSHSPWPFKKAAWQSLLPAPSIFMGASKEGPWICLSRWFLTIYSSTKEKSFFPQVLFLISRAWDFLRTVLAVQTEAKKVFRGQNWLSWNPG